MKAIYTRNSEGIVSEVSSRELRDAIGSFMGVDLVIATTCGCFDILHPGHLRLFEYASSVSVVFIVGVNSDESVRRQGKGKNRPIVPETDRAIMVAGMAAVDYVVIFDETLPNAFLEVVRPDIHIKGGEYDPNTLPEAATVETFGGKCVAFDMIEGESTTTIIERIESNICPYTLKGCWYG